MSRSGLKRPTLLMSTPKNSRFYLVSVGILVVFTLPACKGNRASDHETPSDAKTAVTAAPASVEPARVEVGNDGFQPSTVTLGAGRQLVFRRTSDSTCATAVVFPDLGIEKQLPLNTDVAIDLPASAKGEIGFQCGMGMYKSKVVAQ